jgi:hypothetical protein
MTSRETSRKLFEIVRLVMVPRAGVEPARPYGQRILSPLRNSDLTMIPSELMTGCRRPYVGPENASKYREVTAAGPRYPAGSLTGKRRILQGIDSQRDHNRLQKSPLRNVSLASAILRARKCLGIGVPYGNRTRVAAVKGRCPRPLDERDAHGEQFEAYCKLVKLPYCFEHCQTRTLSPNSIHRLRRLHRLRSKSATLRE